MVSVKCVIDVPAPATRVIPPSSPSSGESGARCRRSTNGSPLWRDVGGKRAAMTRNRAITASGCARTLDRHRVGAKVHRPTIWHERQPEATSYDRCTVARTASFHTIEEAHKHLGIAATRGPERYGEIKRGVADGVPGGATEGALGGWRAEL